jgi:hypothetical protein
VAIFVSLLSETEKADSLLKFAAGDSSHAYDADFGKLAAIPGTPFAYWASDEILNIFLKREAFGDAGRLAQLGASTKNDFRFLRTSWEVREAPSGEWRLFAKGGTKDSFYTDLPLAIRWSEEPREIEAAALTKYTYLSNANWILHTENSYGEPGIYQNQRSDRFSPYIIPSGCVFSSNGVHASTPADQIMSWVALFNSSLCDYLIKLMLGRFGWSLYTTGSLSKLPVPATEVVMASRLAVLGRQGWLLTRQLRQIQETSQAFLLPHRLMSSKLKYNLENIRLNIDGIRSRIDEESYRIYGLSETDRTVIEKWRSGGAVYLDDDGEEEGLEGDDDDSSNSEGDGSATSWAIGVAFGRFDIRLATGERPIPPEPDPFDPLPAKSPGMLPDGDPPFMPTSGVFVDDPGHPDDLIARVTAVHERAGEAPPDELRRTVAKDFFAAHIRMYSKSRRKAPIYWQLATPSASYSVWLYIHAFTKDTLFRVQNEYLAPKLRDERLQLDRLRVDGGATPTGAQSRAIETQSAFVEELSFMLEEVRRVAPLWDPDLDDGVTLNFAPLWRLVPQNRAWQKECRSAWEALVKGDYDWAHLTMRLWPERVVPKCAKDRSLAIAHDLEDIFWVEGADGKWTARKATTRPVVDLIAERTSPAVKAALASLLEAPEPMTAPRRRGRAAG